MGNATSVAARPRFTALGASFTPRLLRFLAPGALGAAFFLAAIRVFLRFFAENDARSARVGEIGPGPFDEHDEPAAEADEEIDVQHQPAPPGEDSGKTQIRQLRDRGMSADSGE